MSSRILEVVARRVRQARGARQWTIRDLAERSGLSIRFLVQLESGTGNISVKRLDDVARALTLSPADLLTEVERACRRRAGFLARGGRERRPWERQHGRRRRGASSEPRARAD